jgi:hypothetical protein
LTGPKFYSCTVTYNDVRALIRNIRSLKPYVDGFVIVDGAFLGFPQSNHEARSTDGTLRAVESLLPPNKRTIIQAPSGGWSSQAEARTEYLKAVPQGDYTFVTDSDETVHGDVKSGFNKIRRLGLPSAAVLCESLIPEWKGAGALIPEASWPNLNTARVYGYMVRIIKNTGSLHYEQHHSQVRDIKTGQQVTTLQSVKGPECYILDFRLVNDKRGQTWQRYQAGNLYRRGRPSPL